MKKTLLAGGIAAILASTAVSAQVPQAEWEQFKAQFSAMSERVKALEIENQKLRAASSNTIKVEDLAATNAEVASLKEQNAESSWADTITWKGDYRFRYENIDQEGRDDRERYRIRARPALVAKTSATTEVGFGMATGGDDPVSTNQTLGGGGTHKELNLDLAYATWTGLENTAITGGKFVNPFYSVEKNQLIFDSDFRPEGVGLSWAGDMLFATGTYSFVESDSDKNDYGIWAVQLGAVFEPIDGATLTAAAAYIDIPTKGQPAIYEDDFYGNSFVVVDGVDVYEYDYKLVNASLGLGITLFDMPFTVYANYVDNQDADDLATGYLAGVQLGKAKAAGQWEVSYEYEDMDANATLGLLTNSDFAGGGTDNKGSTFSAKYAIDSQWYVATTYFFDNKVGVKQGDDANYDRIQLDTGFKY